MVTVSRRTPASPVAEHTEDIVRAFDEHGFVHVPGFFTDQEVARFKAAATDAISAEGTASMVSEASIRTTSNGWKLNDTLRGLVLHPGLGALAERLAGMPLRALGGEVLVKQPHDGPTGLHDDLTAEALDSRISLNAWVALVDVPVERGCLTFFDGSHRREGPERIDTADLNLADLELDDTARSYLFTYWPGLRWTRRVTVPVRGGDVTFHHRRTAHLAGANQSQADRLSMGITFTDAAAIYQPFGNWDPLSCQAGQPLPDERFPRVGTSAREADPR